MKGGAVIDFIVLSALDSNLKNIVNLESKENVGICHNLALYIIFMENILCHVCYICIVCNLMV